MIKNLTRKNISFLYLALLYTNIPVFTAPNGAPLGAVHTGVSDMAFPMKTNRTLVFFYKVKQNKGIF